jgi:Zn-dependent protease
MDWESAFLWFVTLLISLTVHEAAHALFAKLGGDPTAYRLGQVTLNPLPHIQREPFGMVLFPLISLALSGGQSCIGYASTPIDPVWAYHHPRKAAVMSAAGPLANLLLAAVAFAVLVLVGSPASDSGHAVAKIAIVFLALNLLLFLFNLIPLPPLDGAGVVEGLVPKTRGAFDLMRQQPIFGLLTLLIAIKVVPKLFYPVFDLVLGWLQALR